MYTPKAYGRPKELKSNESLFFKISNEIYNYTYFVDYKASNSLLLN